LGAPASGSNKGNVVFFIGYTTRVSIGVAEAG
jgi:hypothetical protein